MSRPPRHPVPDHIPAELHKAFATTTGAAIRPHSPYQLGDPVQLHGYPGADPGHRQTGFRGWVVATLGATILTGITTTGEEWAEYWGRLQPDCLPVNIWGGCTCCQEARRTLRRAYFAEQRAEALQLNLFNRHDAGAPLTATTSRAWTG
jgi:hypothetical protein